MNRNTLLGWALLMMLFLTWTQYKGKEARKHMKPVGADSLTALPAPAGAGSAARAAPTPVMKASDPSTVAPVSAIPASSAVVNMDAVPRRRIRVETPRYTMVLDNRGARIAELRIADLEGKPVYNPVLIRPESEGALTLTLDNHSLADSIWKTETVDTLIRLGSQSVAISFSIPYGTGEVKRTYTFSPDRPGIRHETALPEGVSSYALEWNGGLEETEKIVQGQGIGLMSGYFSEVAYDNGVSVQREAFEGEKTFNAESGVVRWLGLRRKYFAMLLDFRREIQEKVEAVAHAASGQAKDAPKNYSLRVGGSVTGEATALDFDVVVLPLRYGNIKAFGRNYEQILFSGWESFFRADIWYVKLCGLVLKLLNFFHGWVPNYGIAIILLTLLVRLATLPLSITQIRQAAKMAEHQPAIRKIQEKNKGDRQKTQVEIMAYYKAQGINPLAPVMGCFPVLLQMPVFIALFNVLGRAVELHDTPFFGWITDLSLPDVVLPALKVPFLFPVGLTILPFFMAGTMWVQMKMTIKDPNQKMMVWLMPIMMFVFSCSFPSGLVLYWTVSNVFTIGQTKVFTPKKSAVLVAK